MMAFFYRVFTTVAILFLIYTEYQRGKVMIAHGEFIIELQKKIKDLDAIVAGRIK